MNQQTWTSYVALGISLATLLVSAWFLRETRSARFLLTVDGHAYSGVSKETGSYIDLTVAVTNVGRVSTTVTDVFWSISSTAEEEDAVATPEAVSNADIRFNFETKELPLVLEPNSSHDFSMHIPQAKANYATAGRPGATVIRRPKSFRRVSHDNTRTEIFGKERSFPETL